MGDLLDRLREVASNEVITPAGRATVLEAIGSIVELRGLFKCSLGHAFDRGGDDTVIGVKRGLD